MKIQLNSLDEATLTPSEPVSLRRIDPELNTPAAIPREPIAIVIGANTYIVDAGELMRSIQALMKR